MACKGIEVNLIMHEIDYDIQNIMSTHLVITCPLLIGYNAIEKICAQVPISSLKKITSFYCYNLLIPQPIAGIPQAD